MMCEIRRGLVMAALASILFRVDALLSRNRLHPDRRRYISSLRLSSLDSMDAEAMATKLWPICDGPVLTVKQRSSNCTIHLVGVSHGSPASAALVSRVMREVNPASVVVELCEDRFVSISLDAGIRPRGNVTLEATYDEKMKILKEMKKSKKIMKSQSDGEIPLMTRLKSALAFARGQGIVGGVFVLLGLTVSSLQKLSHVGRKQGPQTLCDEFVTALREAETLDIPVVLGDASQNDTLNSIQTVLSSEMFDPWIASRGAMFLAFSALGVYAKESYEALSETIDSEVLRRSEWVSIPQTYTRSKAMLKSLGPFLALALLSTILGYLPEVSAFVSSLKQAFHMSVSTANGDINTAANTISHSAVSSTLTSGLGEVSESWQTDVPPWIKQSADLAADIFSFLLLVRLAKVIGTDRDKIIAANVRKTALASPNEEIVVVVGMLHCNGVGRWLLSEVDPYVFEDTHNTI